MVLLKSPFPTKTAVSQRRFNILLRIYYDYLQGLSTLILHILQNYVNLFGIPVLAICIQINIIFTILYYYIMPTAFANNLNTLS